MAVTPRAALEARVVAFIKDEVPWPRPRRITPDTALLADLRMLWEDAEALMARFFAAFGVDHAGFELSRHFPAPRFFLFHRGKRPTASPLTIRMLVDAAERGAWLAAPPPVRR